MVSGQKHPLGTPAMTSAPIIHHMTRKQAEKYGLRIEESTPGRFVVIILETNKVSNPTYGDPKEALKDAVANLGNDSYWFTVDAKDLADVEPIEAAPTKATKPGKVSEAEAPAEGAEAPPVMSMASGAMAKLYHDRYMHNPDGPGCGDDLDVALRRATKTASDKMDLSKLVFIATTAGVWLPRYDALNPGMARMTVANKLRAILRRDPHARVDIGGEVGRFGVEHKAPSKRSRKSKKEVAA